MNYSLNSKIYVNIEANLSFYFDTFISNSNYDIEYGGILVGTLDPANNTINITDITTPQSQDKQGRTMFTRKEYEHQLIMDNIWEESGNRKTYLGEWHTHCEKNPTPSILDKMNWHTIHRKKHNSEWLFFIILGLDKYKIWTIHEEKIVELLPQGEAK